MYGLSNELTNPAKDGLSTINLEISLVLADDSKVTSTIPSLAGAGQ